MPSPLPTQMLSILSALLVSASVAFGQAVRLDGSIDEWPADTAVLADRHHLHVRAQVERSEHPLQASPETLALWLDADADARTGQAFADPPDAAGMGIDLVIEFSPQPAGRGVACWALPGREAVAHAALGVEFAPTHAAPWYEIRLARAHAAGSAGAQGGSVAAALARAGSVRGLLVLHDSAGAVVGWSEPFMARMPEAAPVPLSDALPVAKARDSVRVVSWNVLRASPEANPEPFARVLQALAPDVVVVQEWTNDGPEALRSWATAMLGTSASSPDLTAWNTLTNEAWGVGILSPHPLEPVGSALTLEGERHPVRFIAAVARTPRGPVLVASVHLKCCGGAAGDEERTRVAEAGAINAAVREALALVGPMPVVIAGDYNLVGGRAPLEILGRGLGRRGRDLRPAEAWLLGDTVMRTWRGPESEFTPGRLDYALLDGTPAQAFVFDTAHLSDAALARLGLDRGDTTASDHLPLVVDVGM